MTWIFLIITTSSQVFAAVNEKIYSRRMVTDGRGTAVWWLYKPWGHRQCRKNTLWGQVVNTCFVLLKGIFPAVLSGWWLFIKGNRHSFTQNVLIPQTAIKTAPSRNKWNTIFQSDEVTGKQQVRSLKWKQAIVSSRQSAMNYCCHCYCLCVISLHITTRFRPWFHHSFPNNDHQSADLKADV